LEGLSAAEARALLERKVGATLPEAATDWVYRHAAGNPLFTLEYLRYLARQGYLWNDGQRWRWRAPPKGTIPTTVEALLERLIMQVPPGPPRDLLEAAALLPADAPATLRSEVAGLSEEALETARVALERRGLFRAETFAHPLFREVTLRGLSPPRRRDLSRRALAALSDDPQTAASFVADAGLELEEAVRLLVRAAEHAKDKGNLLQAARLKAQAAPYARDEIKGTLVLEAAEVLQHHDLPEAARLAELALTTPAASAEAVRLYAHLLARQGHLDELERWLEELPPNLAEPLHAAALRVTSRNIAGDHGGALAVWDAHPELHAAPPPELLRAVAASALATGRMDQAEALTAEGLQTTHEPRLRSEFLSIRALTFYHRSDYTAAEAAIREVLELLEGMDAPRLRSTALLNRAAFLRMLGDYAAMGACLEEVLEIRRVVGDGRSYAFAQAALAELRTEQGRYEEAEDLLLEAIPTLERYGPSRFLINAHAMASVLYTAQATPLSKLVALKHGEQALSYARQLGSPRVVREILFDASLANTRSGNVRRGLQLAEEAQRLAEGAGNAPFDNLRTLWALALAVEASGELDRAGAYLNDAQQLAQVANVALEAQKIGLEHDRLMGDVASAKERLAWFEERGLINGVNLTKRYFPELASKRAETQTGETARLEVLGPMRIVRGGRAEGVRGEKRRQLLALLLEARIGGRSEVDQLTLLDALYPDEPEDAAGAALKQLVFQLRKGFGDGAIVRTPGGYALGALASDAEAFLISGDTRLWRGAYLGDASTSDETVRNALFHALKSCSSKVLERDPAEASRLGRILMDTEPYDAEALRLTLKALRQDGNLRAAEKLYREGRTRLLEVGEVLPDSWPDFLEQKIS